MIELKGISKRFGKLQVLEDINLSVGQGEKLCVIGRSGIGKSVMLKIMTGLIKPDTGQIFFEGEDITNFRREQWNRLMGRFGVVFQGAALFDSLTVFENVAIRLIEERQVPRDEMRGKAAEALREVGLDPDDVLDKYPAALSGGMQKRVGIARAIVHRPDYLFYDEPTTGLDPVTSGMIDDLIEKLAAQPGRTSVIITHDMYTVQEIATDVAMIENRVLHFQGSPKDLFSSEDPVVKRFLSRLNVHTQANG